MTTHTAAFPSVIAAIVSMATLAVAPARVTRGRDISDDPADVVMVGVRDLEADPDSPGSFQQTMQTFGGNREEVGEVHGLIVAWNGQSDQDAACSTAFGYLAGIEAAVRARQDPGLTATFDYMGRDSGRRRRGVTEQRGSHHGPVFHHHLQGRI
jgi:hypothetical protein